MVQSRTKVHGPSLTRLSAVQARFGKRRTGRLRVAAAPLRASAEDPRNVQLEMVATAATIRRRMRREIWIVFLVAAFAWPIADAGAHGHPVIEGLYNGNVYVPAQRGPKPALSAALARSVESVYAHHLRIKVGVVASPADLGVLSGLWGKPYRYAKHLATDLSALYVGPFLIVMPAGFAVYDGGRSVAAERRALTRVRLVRRDPDGLTRAANDAVQALLHAHALRSKDITSPFAYASPTTVHPGSLASRVSRSATTACGVGCQRASSPIPDGSGSSAKRASSASARRSRSSSTGASRRPCLKRGSASALLLWTGAVTAVTTPAAT